MEIAGKTSSADRSDWRHRPRDRQSPSPPRAPRWSSARARGRSSTRSRPRFPAAGHSVIVSDLAEAGRRRGARRRRPWRTGRSTCSSPTPACPAPAASTSSAPRTSPGRCGSTSSRPILLARALAAGDARARLRPPRLRLLAGRQGRLPARLDLQRDQVRPARLLAGPARGLRRRRRRRRLGRPAGLHPRRRHVRRLRQPSSRPASAPRPRRRSPPVSPRRSSATRPRSRSRPPQQRALVGFAHIFPGFAARAQRGAGTKIAEELARGQTDKR